MNSELIMKSDVLDILFENRNKLYGAYALRKFYNSRLTKSINITLTTVAILCAFTFLPKKDAGLITYKEITMAHINPPKAPEVKNELPKPKPVKSAAFLPHNINRPLIVSDIHKADTIQYIQPTNVSGPVNILKNGSDGLAIIGAPSNGNGTDGQPQAATTQPADISKPVDNPEIAPIFPGGMNALRRFLQNNLVNPTEMEGEMVSVTIRFVVGYDGKLQNFTIVKDGGQLYNNEVIRVMQKMPQWIPGRSNGKNVAVYLSIPVKFVPAD